MPYGKRKGYVPRRPRRTRPSTKYTKKGLTKTEKSQVKNIAKKAVNTLAETKYFNVSGFKENKPLHYASINKKGMGVRGYCTCENKNSQNVKITYGVETVGEDTAYIDELNMNRCFSRDSSTDFFKSQAICGAYASPSFAQSTFVLEREVAYITGEASDYSTLNHAPYFVRMVRVSPRPSKLSTVSIMPSTDLFVDEWGRHTGISDSTFLNHQLMTYKLNGRKYKIIEDKSFIMAPPMILNNVATGQSDTDPLTEVNGDVNNYNIGNCMKTFQNRHDIGKKLFFEDGGEEEANSTSGQQNEFIFFHTCLLGINASASINSYRANHLLISTKSVSSFKDI
jgi:hypothetical protein